MKIKSFVLKLWYNEDFQKKLRTFGWQTSQLFVAFLVGVIGIIQPDVVNPVAVLVLAGLASVLLQASKHINKKLSK